ncbi:hypothetical protein [Streptomyces millisiae]|uniref:ParB/Sulfiredoxin domain-containing protein n=1 Tax=Streptomyces millisiae TaxID=3075542 RepID=A0ABU2LV00_9ACTN|nr:hypothetical protein [Streptomyces sp. DSM 44918]MDT0321427.1 hypothetical protein [Streptomyces sp. DSM 44918]
MVSTRDRSDTALRVGDYLGIARGPWPRGEPRGGAGFARIERLERLDDPSGLLEPPDDVLGALLVGAATDPIVVAFCHGVPGPLLLRRGDHEIWDDVDPERRALDDGRPWWGLGERPLFAGAALAPCPNAGIANVGNAAPRALAEEAGVGRRRAASFAKPAASLRAGDYLQIHTERLPAVDAAPDEGFYRVEWLGQVEDAAMPVWLNDRAWAGDALVLARVHELPGTLVLPGRQRVRVLIQPNIERVAWDREDPSGVGFAFRQVREIGRDPSDHPVPEPPADEAALYPSVYRDPRARRLRLEGRDAVRIVPLTALPWPHGLFKCPHAERAKALERTYPREKAAGQVAHAELFARLTPEDFAACPYHQQELDWPAIAAAVCDAWRSVPAETKQEQRFEAVDRVMADPRLTGQERVWAQRLCAVPITWTEGALTLTDGQHRLCALRAGGVEAIGVDGRHLPDATYPPPEEAAEHARRTVKDFWTAHCSARFGTGRWARLATRAAVRSRLVRRLLRVGHRGT